MRRYQEALIDYKDLLNKTVTNIHQELATKINVIKTKVDNTQS